jgi:2-dehydropantoate 2-reductase
MRIAVIGSGAMGCLYGAYLSRVASVALFDPWQEHVRAIQSEGLLLDELDGSQQRYCIPATTEVAELGTADLALISVKSHQTGWAADIARQVLSPMGIAVTLQNGLGNREIIAEAVTDERTVQGVTAHGATLLGPGHVRHAGQGPTHLALTRSTAAQVQQIATILRAAGFEAEASEGLDSLIWGKLIVNAGINALTAILRVPNGQLVRNPTAQQIMCEAVREAAAVAYALGVRLPYADAVERVEAVCRATATNRSSMLQDVLRGNPTEIGVINAVIVKEGQRTGVATPINSVLVSLVRAIESSYETRI